MEGYANTESSLVEALMSMDTSISTVIEPQDNSGDPCSPFASLLRVIAESPKADPSPELCAYEKTDPHDVACRLYEQVTENAYEIEGLKADHHFHGGKNKIAVSRS